MKKTLLILSIMAVVSLSALAQSSVTVSWPAVTQYEDNSPVGTDIVKYDVYRSLNSDLSAAVKLTATSITNLTYTDNSITVRNNYYYFARSYVSPSNTSSNSNNIKVNTHPPKAPVISATPN